MVFTIANGERVMSQTKCNIQIGQFYFPAMSVEGLHIPLIAVNVLTQQDQQVEFGKSDVYARDVSNLEEFGQKLWKIAEISHDGTYRLTEDDFCMPIDEVHKNLNFKLMKLYSATRIDASYLPSIFRSLSQA